MLSDYYYYQREDSLSIHHRGSSKFVDVVCMPLSGHVPINTGFWHLCFIKLGDIEVLGNWINGST